MAEEYAVRYTNPDKVLYPATGRTKGEIIVDYREIAPLMLPGLTDRPVTRKRWPSGVEQEPFLTQGPGLRHPGLDLADDDHSLR